MTILKCNADYDKVYFVEYNGTLRECKLIRTEGGLARGVYVLNVAGVGETHFDCLSRRFNQWYMSGKLPSILYASVEDYKKGNPIMDEYGSTSNAYNFSFLDPLLKYHDPCNCGGYTYTWRWNGVKAVCHSVDVSRTAWTWDENGFHCSLNDENAWKDCYKSKEACERANTISVVGFDK